VSDAYDIAIVGSGFAGSLLAMVAHKLGRTVLLLERGSHPRPVIGESSTPLANLLLEELATRYDLEALRPLSKWGTWQRSHPELACGLKRGFTFHHHVLGRPVPPDPGRRDQLLVAASPHDDVADTHWYRADFDHFFVREAQRLGVEYADRVKLDRMYDDGSVVGLEGVRDGRAVRHRARFVIDATGSRGFLHRTLKLGEAQFPNYPATEALYSHFSGVAKLADGNASRLAGHDVPPYSIDDAAVHHVFDGGWVWVLQFNNGITSAGVAATSRIADQLRFEEGAPAWQRLLDGIPGLREQFATARAEAPFTHMPQLSFRSDRIAGDKWAMLPSAAGFVDPLLSTGFVLTLLGVGRLAEVIAHKWGTEEFGVSLGEYATKTEAELLAAGRMTAALYTTMGNFPAFTSLSLLYFAAASYSEAARRLNRLDLAPSFLLHDDGAFGPLCLSLFERARTVRTGEESRRLSEEIRCAIEPWNVAGLGDPARRNWYPVQSKDLIDSAWKLNATKLEAADLMVRCGFSL